MSWWLKQLIKKPFQWNNLKPNIGLVLCITSLVFYFLLRLPFNLSVECANENQGFAFTWGQSFLLWNELASGRGPLYVLLYSLVLKIFGFNTWSIISMHYIESSLYIIAGLLIFFIVKITSKSSFLGGLTTLIWIILISTPIGGSLLKVEIRSHYNLNEESLCVFFSLLSLFFLTLGNFTELSQPIKSTKEKMYLVLAGLFSVCSLMSKANGAILLIAVILWFLQMIICRKGSIKALISKFVFYLFGVFVSLLFFNIFIFALQGSLFSFWKDYFLLGNYTSSYLATSKSLFLSIVNFLTRYTNSLNNLFLLVTSCLFFSFGIIKGCLAKKHQDNVSVFWSLIGIWGLGNACAIIAPGTYQPYYYHLIWPSIAIVLALGLNSLFARLQKTNNKFIIYLASSLILLFFVYRIFISIPAYYELGKELNNSNIFLQPQSFQDPVLPYNVTLTKREGLLKAADAINVLIPNKKELLYIFNFGSKGVTGFTPLTYIYSKRYSPTTVDSALLQVPTIIESKLKVLKEDLTKRPPDILIISKDIYLEPWQKQHIIPFLNWFTGFIQTNKYEIIKVLNFSHVENEKIETFNVYRRGKEGFKK